MAIEIKNVSKTFGSTAALSDVTLTIDKGHIYGLLGNNGAGKSTLFNAITNRLFQDSGEILVDGGVNWSSDDCLGKIFMIGEDNMYPDDMKVKAAYKATKVFNAEFDEAKAYELSEKFGLDTNKKITKLSTGYKSIFRLIIGLCVSKPYILFDEPVLGLDARHRDMFYKYLIEKCANDDCAVVISTHLISEVANIVEHAFILCDGKLIKDMAVEELLKGSISVSGPASAVDEYAKDLKVLNQVNIGGLKTIVAECTDVKPAPAGVEVSNVNLQDYFIGLMNSKEEQHEN